MSSSSSLLLLALGFGFLALRKEREGWVRAFMWVGNLCVSVGEVCNGYLVSILNPREREVKVRNQGDDEAEEEEHVLVFEVIVH